MLRTPSLFAFGLVMALFFSAASQEVEATGWKHKGYYSSAYFHDYYNYGARYSYRPYASYYGYYGVSPYSSYGWRGYYGGWSTYAPYAYTPSAYVAPSYSYYASPTYHVSYAAPVSVGCSSCATNVAPVVANYGATCCSADIAYGPGIFGHKHYKHHRGLLGPLCPLKGWGYGTCGSFGYGGCCGW